MRRTILVTLSLPVLFLGSACAGTIYEPGPPPAWGPGPDASVEVSFFHGELAPYGDWLRVEPRPLRRAVPVARNPEILRQMRDVTRYEELGERVAVRSVPVEEIEGRTRRAVPRYEVEELTAPPRRAEPADRGRVRIYRPEPSARPPAREPEPAAEERRKAVPRKPPPG